MTLLTLIAGVFLTTSQFAPDIAFAQNAGRILLDADNISFEEATGTATAEGNVRIDNEEIRLFAPYVEYNSQTQQVKAYSSPEGTVTFLAAGRRLSGEKLDYNITSRHGVLMQPSGKIDSFYVKGDSLMVQPASEVASPRKDAKDMDEDDMAAFWNQASLTTCDLPHPHYRLEAKSVTVIPNRSVMIKKPRVYMGERMIFSYPFDYYIPLRDQRDKRRRQSIFPRIGYESSKGVGLGVTGAYGWESGMLGLDVIGWTDGIWEGDALLTQDIGRDLEILGGVKRRYDKDADTTLWRPSWGLEYQPPSGWQLELGWAQRELLSVEKRAGSDTKYVVWKEPEFNIISPWFKDKAAGGYYRFMGSWGRYEDATRGRSPTVERWGLGAQVYGEFNNSRDNFRPFYNAIYWYYDYDSDISGRQEILDAVVGARWRLGEFDMETAYLRRWSWGNSPMEWDDYDDREDIYQQISYRFPTKSQTESWIVGVRGAYSLRDEELHEMVYKVAYDQHCLLWEALYRDDKYGNDNWFGLKLTIKAYPESGVRLSGNDLFEPAQAPSELAPYFD